ncbi:MAG: tetratricopeptide repeat protein [Nitrospirae bacterium]|nr:tetratricopeptide repeat protein [Nitrospirota bacterium]
MIRHIALILLMAVTAYGSDTTKEVFKKAAVYYVEGKYESAIAQYESLLTGGLESGELYYNIGNCYFKTGDLGRSTLYYERAKRLIPNDADLKANYEFVRSQLPDKGKSQQPALFKRLLDRVFGVFTIDGICVMITVLYIFVVALLITRFYLDAVRRYLLLLISITAIVFVVASFVLYERISVAGSEAVVLADKAEVRYEPFSDATVFFTITVGTKVQVQQIKSDWYKVRRLDGKQGWVSRKAIAVVAEKGEQ